MNLCLVKVEVEDGAIHSAGRLAGQRRGSERISESARPPRATPGFVSPDGLKSAAHGPPSPDLRSDESEVATAGDGDSQPPATAEPGAAG